MSTLVTHPEHPAHDEDPILVGMPTDEELTNKLLEPVWPGGPRYRALLWVTGLGTLMFLSMLLYTINAGIGVWGNNIPVAWAFGIINFVWWIGIGHAGTFISAILLLLGQRWRTSINRLAEAMTLFALVNAGLYPIAHLGRAWFFYWLVPYPSTMQVWPNFKSALAWDIAAITTYATISFLFWYLGLIPDFATARDSAPTRWRRRIYGVFALGWRGSVRHWRHYRFTYGLLAGLATPLVLSVHSVVSFDFATTKVPGWHSTVFPPYFVAGAIFSGFAMVLTLMLPLRAYLRLHHVITDRHLDAMAKVLLATGLMVAYSYLIESFIGYYSAERYEVYALITNRFFGPYAGVFWLSVFCNVLVPQLLWMRFFRRNVVALFIISILVNVGMWAERFVIIVISLHRDFLPSSWGPFTPSLVDWTLFAGTLCVFVFLFLLFVRFVPFIPITELKEMKHELKHEQAAALKGQPHA